MANSYLDFLNRSARINDSLLIAIIGFAADIVRQDDAFGQIAHIIHEWKLAVCDAPPGLIEIDLSGYWETTNGRNQLLSLLKSAKKRIESFGDTVPHGTLNSLINHNGMLYIDVKTDLLISGLEKWISMIRPDERT